MRECGPAWEGWLGLPALALPGGGGVTGQGRGAAESPPPRRKLCFLKWQNQKGLRERGLAAVSRGRGPEHLVGPAPGSIPNISLSAGEGVRTGHSWSPARLESSGTSNPGLMGSGALGLQRVLAHQAQLRVLRPSPSPKQLSSGTLVAGGRGRQ